MGSSYAREFACYASRRIDSVWFESTHKRLFYKIKKRVTETITLSSGGRGWIRTTEVIDDRFTVCQAPFIYNDFEKCNTEVTQ